MRTRDKDRANKLINEFIHGKSDPRMFIQGGFKTLIVDYSVRWDAIMPLAKKCIDTYHDHREDIFSALHKVDKDALFIAIVKFIKWCNAHPENIEGYKETKPYGKVERILWTTPKMRQLAEADIEKQKAQKKTKVK